MDYSELVSSTNKKFVLAQKIHRLVKSDRFLEVIKYCTENERQELFLTLQAGQYDSAVTLIEQIRSDSIELMPIAQLRAKAQSEGIKAYNQLSVYQLRKELHNAKEQQTD